MLVALKEESNGIFEALAVSENSHALCRYSPEDIFALASFCSIFPEEKRPAFAHQARIIRSQFLLAPKSTEPKVFPIPFMDPLGGLIPCWCAIHCAGIDQSVLICEFEPLIYPRITMMTPLSDIESPLENQEDDPMDAAEIQGTTLRSLHLSSGIDDLFNGGGRATEILSIISQIQQRFSAAIVVQDLLNILVGVMQELTKFDRCMVYQFDDSFNAMVVAERVHPRLGREIYNGLQFPAADMLKQAGDDYGINSIPMLFDRQQRPVRLLGRTVTDLMTPLDLTYAYLRTMAPVHINYLEDMGVRSTMTVSLRQQGEPWGLICCHSYGLATTRIPFPIRTLCYWVSQCASNCLDRLLDVPLVQARKLQNPLHVDKTPDAFISASSDELLRLFQADSGFLVVKGEAKTIGRLASYQEAITLLRYVFLRKFKHIYATQSITTDFTDLSYEPTFKHIAGLLFIPLSANPTDFVLFFRKDQHKEVHWAGSPSVSLSGSRTSKSAFRKWTERVHGTCIGWTRDQLDTAAMARLVYGNFIRVWREKEAALQDTRMKRLLMLNASHEVRTLLNILVNYLEMASERPLDKPTKEILSMSHTASKSLIYFIDDLLHLTGSRDGPIPPLQEAFDIRLGLQQTLEQLRQHAARKSLAFEVFIHPEFPHFVQGDLLRLQQAMLSLVSNAIQYTYSGGVTIQLGQVFETETDCLAQIIIQDTGVGMSDNELDDLFMDLEEVRGEDFQEEESPLEVKPRIPRDGVKSLKLGLGLALVARFVKTRNGQIRLKSTKGKGSTVTLDLPFKLCPEAAHPFQSSLNLQAQSSESAQRQSLPVRPKLGANREAEESARSQAYFTSRNGTYPRQQSIIASPSETYSRPSNDEMQDLGDRHLTVLVADDNSINLQILQRRLGKMGHDVRVSWDGQECFDLLKVHQSDIDFILMDLEMPFVNGWQATQMIRSLEKTTTDIPHSTDEYGRIPIFAISATLRKEQRQSFAASGFDGWLLKPVDFKRLALILSGAFNADSRKRGLYEEASFQQGGWFSERCVDI
ncbi:Response regulator receiver domain-containing protein isoform 1 [Cladophialophora immunda]|nr:Response regulator receiver domain-containing protein isoform 1 [Cladophialophora immunda]